MRNKAERLKKETKRERVTLLRSVLKRRERNEEVVGSGGVTAKLSKLL